MWDSGDLALPRASGSSGSCGRGIDFCTAPGACLLQQLVRECRIVQRPGDCQILAMDVSNICRTSVVAPLAHMGLGMKCGVAFEVGRGTAGAWTSDW